MQFWMHASCGFPFEAHCLHAKADTNYADVYHSISTTCDVHSSYQFGAMTGATTLIYKQRLSCLIEQSMILHAKVIILSTIYAWSSNGHKETHSLYSNVRCVGGILCHVVQCSQFSISQSDIFLDIVALAYVVEIIYSQLNIGLVHIFKCIH